MRIIGSNKFILTVTFCCCLFLLLAKCTSPQKMLPENHFIAKDGKRPMIIAHGGAKHLFPENTLLAFDSVSIIGVDVLEIDVRITKDSILVTHHDAEIDNTSDGSGMLYDFTYKELLAFNFGYKFTDIYGKQPYQHKQLQIASLKDVFLNHPEIYMIAEIKDEGERGRLAARKMKSLIEECSMQNKVIVASFHHEILQYFREISGGSIPVSAAQKDATKFVLSSKAFMSFLHRPDYIALQLPQRAAGMNLGTKRVINTAHRRNIAVQYWTINDKENMRKLIENGADGIITDRPDLMRELLIEMGYSIN